MTLVVSGSTQVDARIFTESANGTIFGGVATLIVTVDQLENDHIGVMVYMYVRSCNAAGPCAIHAGETVLRLAWHVYTTCDSI